MKKPPHSPFNPWFIACLVTLALLVTGCPHNQYIVELTPLGITIERKLTFYREDGSDTNGVPSYQSFPRDELALISKCYPPANLTRNGERWTAKGEFAIAMPADIGGAGSYRTFTTSLGSSSAYVERFRGNDDLTARIEKRSKAADQLTDLVIGWSQRQFGGERSYKKLRRFLDVDFRRDLKNLSFYVWMFQDFPAAKEGRQEDIAVRFGQYLVERGYLSLEDLPDIFRIASEDRPERLLRLVRRLIAVKLEIPKTDRLHSSLAILEDPDAAWKSWEQYLTTTPLYRARLQHWQKDKMIWQMKATQRQIIGFLLSGARTNSPSVANPKPNKPEAGDVAAELTMELLELDALSTSDHLTVRLSLPSPPGRTNGKWDEKRNQVLWESDLEERTNAVRLPVDCYASWSQPNERFQSEHFGKVVLEGEKLTQYCLWRGGLDENQGRKWDALLADLKPEQVIGRIDSFRFSGEPANPQKDQTSKSQADFARELIKMGLVEKPARSAASAK